MHRNFFFPGSLPVSVSDIENINPFLKLGVRLPLFTSIMFFEELKKKKTQIFYFYISNVKFATLKIEYWKTFTIM